MSRYVDEHRGRFGVEPICKTLGVSVSAYYQRRSGRSSARAVEDERLLARIRELHAANYYAYGYRRMWKTLRRAGEQVPRCRVQRLMKTIYLTEIRPGDVAGHSVVDRMMDRASVILEFDQENRLIGIELLGASRALPPDALETAETP